MDTKYSLPIVILSNVAGWIVGYIVFLILNYIATLVFNHISIFALPFFMAR